MLLMMSTLECVEILDDADDDDDDDDDDDVNDASVRMEITVYSVQGRPMRETRMS